MAAYKRYINPKEPGLTCFVTATCVDFAHLFRRDELKTQMCLSILDDCRKRQAKLQAFVVMSNHIHMLVRPNAKENISQFMQPLKVNAVELVKPLFTDVEVRQLSNQIGLSRRTFWKRSFRASAMDTESLLFQKLHYLHANPVRAKQCELAEDYLWSSAHLRLNGWFDEEDSLDLRLASEFYVRLSSR